MTVEQGRVTKIAPNPEHPASRGAFCVKGIRGAKEWTYQDSRLRKPLRRAGPRGSGQFVEIGWDEALDEMADAFARIRAEYGARALVGAVSGAFFSRGIAISQLMRSIGSPNWMVNQDLCGGCRATSEKMTGLDIAGGEDIANTSCALIAGKNPAMADPPQWMALKAAQARGAKIVVVDPFKTSAAEIADLWLRPTPGTDAAIALAMIRVSIDEGLYDRAFVAERCHGFDELNERTRTCTPQWAEKMTGVAAADVVEAARLYGKGPSCLLSGHGIDAASNAVQTCRSYHALVAISGNVDRVGGNRRVKRPPGFRTNFDVLFDPAFRLHPDVEAQRIGADEFPLWSGPLGFQMACHNPSVLDAMLTGKPYPVRGIYISGVNIAVMYPDTRRTIEALMSLDYVVVGAHTMTPTALYADLILPKTTTIEEEQVSPHQGGPCLTYTAAASVPDGDVRNDFEIAAALLDRLRSRGAVERDLFPWRTLEQYNAYLLAETDVDLAHLRRVGYAVFPYEMGDFDAKPFRTPSGRLELFSQTLAAHGQDPLPAYIPPSFAHEAEDVAAAFPLILQTGLREKSYHHSRFREQSWARKVSPDPVAYIHPATAERYGIADDSWIEVEVAHGTGRCRLKANISNNTMVDVLTTGVGWWNPERRETQFDVLSININAALSYSRRYDATSGSADTRGIACRIVAVAERMAAE